nr:unnamed protein product [Callosobruchus analis]
MEKDVQVECPKRKKKAGGVKLRFGVSEPVRKTLYDIFMENLQTLNRVTFIHRVIYAGKHKSSTQLPIIFKTIINGVNNEYYRERLTGFLLIYSTFFIHVVEGSEDAILKHLSILLESPDHSDCVGETKLLIQISNVLKRLSPESITYHGVPSRTLTPLYEIANMTNTAQTLYKCLRQTYELIKAFIRSKYELNGLRKSPVSHESRSDKKARNANISPSNNAIPSTSVQDKDQYMQNLPEMELIEALIESPYTQKLESYYELLLDCDLIPYDIFSTTFDNVTELVRHGEDSKEQAHDKRSKEKEEMSEEYSELMNL